MDALLVYIAADQRLALWRATPLPDRDRGTVLFADISGFTTLTETLARALGPRRGAEEVTRQLNEVYDVLTATVERYGGSIVGFSGDGFICWFPGDDGTGSDARSAALGAVTCALHMQNGMRRFATLALAGGEQVSLAMKVAVASGPVRRFLVGDPAVQLFDVLAGATLDRLGAIEGFAARGEVWVDQPTADLLPDATIEWREPPGWGRAAIVRGLQEEASPAPWPELPPGALPADQLRPWVLPAVHARLLSG